MGISCSGPIRKRVCSETNSKAPKSSNDPKIYKYVLPSAKIIWNYKNLQATQEETNASIKLFKKSSNEKVKLHFDTISQCSIDGERLAIILNILSDVRFSIQPLVFVYEDCENITDLIIEPLKLAVEIWWD